MLQLRTLTFIALGIALIFACVGVLAEKLNWIRPSVAGRLGKILGTMIGVLIISAIFQSISYPGRP